MEILISSLIWIITLGASFYFGRQGFLSSEEQQHNMGERIVQGAIGATLPREKYHLLNNVTLPIDDGRTTQIDHILISRFGVFVIETKHYSGVVTGSKTALKWTQTTKFDKREFQNPLRQNYHHVKELEALLPEINKKAIISVIAFTGSANLEGNMPENVVHPPSLISFIGNHEKEILSSHDVELVVGRIETTRKEESEKTDEEHLEGLRARHN